jgi:lon-related putative ATP-dependent protease
MPRVLTPENLRRRTAAEEVGFTSTQDAPDTHVIFGQERAMDAIRFGVQIDRKGYNLFVLGPSGVGKHTIVQQFLLERAATEPVPEDLCYVHNFQHPHQPTALRLPAGVGSRLQRDMVVLVQEIRPALAQAFESEEFRARSQAIEHTFKGRQEAAFSALHEQAAGLDLVMLNTPMGIGFAPRKGTEVLPPEEFKALPEADRQRLQKAIETMEEALQGVLRQVPRWEREGREEMRQLQREVCSFAVSALMADERERYRDLPGVLAYLDAVLQDVVENVGQFARPKGDEASDGADKPEVVEGDGPPFLRRYRVNVLVDQGDTHGAPVIYEDNPTHTNLVGRVEYLAQMGALVTDFNLIKPGALQRANGGYLILDAVKVLAQPFGWDSLKRALHARQVRIESPGQMLTAVNTISLEPEPTAIDLKVVLIGDRQLYYLLSALDPDFDELFKVAADFEEDTARTPEAVQAYSQILATIVRREGLRPFDAAAIAHIIDASARSSGDAEKLSTGLHQSTDILFEADQWAAERGADLVTAADVEHAIAARLRRISRVRDLLQEQILRQTVLVDTSGERIGQVNGLSVLQLGPVMFGQPSRITARVWLGRGNLVDIEREVKLGGPIHTKGVLILSAFLCGRFAVDRPLSLSASLVFEQSYGGVDGDSASAAELYTLLSAIAEVPVRQSLAITGSVNQHGEVQAIGGVNEKIEGFFDVCNARGLTGEQGVIIPESNVKHLMLRQYVVDAVANGRFHVWSIATIDDGVELLLGMPAGTPNPDGTYPEGTLNHRVATRLAAMAERRQAFGAGWRGESRPTAEDE